MKYLKKLCKSKATGLDGLGPKILGQCCDIIAPSLTYLINLSIRKGVFPNILKRARVSPVFKGGDVYSPDNYRPISVLPTLSKIIERHIVDQLNGYLSKHDLLYKSQSGFRPMHSCQTALTKLVDTWLKNMDNGELNGVLFLDLKKAFDLVNHDLLLTKLKIYRFSNITIEWFSSYLYDRAQLQRLEIQFHRKEM